MDEIKLKELWQATNEKLEQSQNDSKQQTDDITHLKVQNFISSIKPIKIFTILVGVGWVFILGTVVLNLFVYAFDTASPFFLFSAAIQVILTAIALVIYIYQLITIYQIDITEPILKTQQKIANLQLTTLWITRVLMLQLPVWTTFYWNVSMIEHGNWVLIIIQGIVTLSFAIAAIWLFININYGNKDKKWFRLIFKGKEWTPLMKSMELLEQIDEYHNVAKS